MSQCGQRASFNRDRDLADEPHWCLSVFGCRNACGLADSIDIVEVDDIIKRLAWAAKLYGGVAETVSATREAGRVIGNGKIQLTQVSSLRESFGVMMFSRG